MTIAPPPGAEKFVKMRSFKGSKSAPQPDYIPPGVEASPSSRRSMVIEWFDDAADTALSDPNTPLIDGLLDEGAMSVIYGDSNAGKTFVALDLSYCVAAGISWNDKATKQGLVVYVAAEGGMKIKRRIAALRKVHNGGDKPFFALVRYPIDLRSTDADLNQLLALVRGAESAIGQKCVWLIIDTLSRAMAGGDENSPVDMGRIVTAADRLRAETGTHFTFVHHTGKDAARGARGHSLLRAATDTEIEITPETLTATKQRDMEGGFAIGFRLMDVDLGQDQYQRQIRSATVEWNFQHSRTAEKKEKAIPSSMRLLMDTIAAVIGEMGQLIRPFHDGPLVKAVPDEVVRARFYEHIAEQALPEEDQSVLAERQRKSFNRSIKGAIERRLALATEWKKERWLWLP